MRSATRSISSAYQERIPLLRSLAQTLESDLRSLLADIPNVDRIYFRFKDPESFIKKATEKTRTGTRRYVHPLEQIEDQVAGRVLVLYRTDIAAVLSALEGKWPKAEQKHRRPRSSSQFEYETTHRICLIAPDMRPRGWSEMVEPPTTFELQIRTLAQHAWSEPQHAFYKRRGGLKKGSKRKLYWAAASAWGIDSIWEDIQEELKQIDH
jgi:putative GTP pyrophosphokinase